MFQNVCLRCCNGSLNVGGVESRVGTNHVLERMRVQQKAHEYKKLYSEKRSDLTSLASFAVIIKLR